MYCILAYPNTSNIRISKATSIKYFVISVCSIRVNVCFIAIVRYKTQWVSVILKLTYLNTMAHFRNKGVTTIFSKVGWARAHPGLPLATPLIYGLGFFTALDNWGSTVFNSFMITCRYTSGHFIPNSVMVTVYWIRCLLVYLQV